MRLCGTLAGSASGGLAALTGTNSQQKAHSAAPQPPAFTANSSGEAAQLVLTAADLVAEPSATQAEHNQTLAKCQKVEALLDGFVTLYRAEDGTVDSAMLGPHNK